MCRRERERAALKKSVPHSWRTYWLKATPLCNVCQSPLTGKSLRFPIITFNYFLILPKFTLYTYKGAAQDGHDKQGLADESKHNAMRFSGARHSSVRDARALYSRQLEALVR
jgi:hypothetical protein